MSACTYVCLICVPGAFCLAVVCECLSACLCACLCAMIVKSVQTAKTAHSPIALTHTHTCVHTRAHTLTRFLSSLLQHTNTPVASFSALLSACPRFFSVFFFLSFSLAHAHTRAHFLSFCFFLTRIRSCIHKTTCHLRAWCKRYIHIADRSAPLT